jgi:hypothetical protein
MNHYQKSEWIILQIADGRGKYLIVAYPIGYLVNSSSQALKAKGEREK